MVVVACGVVFAFWLPGVVAGLEIFWKIAPMMGISFWLMVWSLDYWISGRMGLCGDYYLLFVFDNLIVKV